MRRPDSVEKSERSDGPERQKMFDARLREPIFKWWKAALGCTMDRRAVDPDGAGPNVFSTGVFSLDSMQGIEIKTLPRTVTSGQILTVIYFLTAYGLNESVPHILLNQQGAIRSVLAETSRTFSYSLSIRCLFVDIWKICSNKPNFHGDALGVSGEHRSGGSISADKSPWANPAEPFFSTIWDAGGRSNIFHYIRFFA